MKTKPFFHHTRALIALGMSVCLLMSQAVFAAGTSHAGMEVSKKNPEDDKPGKAKAKTSSSRNNVSVKIYPDILKRDMHVIAKEKEGKEIDFFVFDLQGTLVQNFKMKQKEHRKITGLARGKYMYHVFSGDEETASGEFEIR